MKAKLILGLILLSFISYAQKSPDQSITLDSKIVNINLHQITGIPVVTTKGAVYGINGETGEKIWEFKETGFIKSLNQLGQDGGTSFSEVPFSPYGKFNQTVFNIKSGNKILNDKDNGFEDVVDSKYITGKKGILFFGRTAKTEAKLFLISIENDKLLWESKIKSNKKIQSKLTGLGGISNFIQNENRIAFTTGKTVFLVDKESGNIILTEKYDAGKLFFSEDKKALIAVENKGSSLIGGAIKAGLTMGLSLLKKKVIGKEVLAFDINTGEEFWKKPIKLSEGFIDYQFVDGKLFLMHKDGASLYDPTSGKEVWKKEFSKSKVKYAEKTPEGYMVYFKNKKQLVDNVGKRIWKRPQKVVKNADFEVDDEEDYTSFEYDSGVVFMTPTRIEYFKKGEEKRDYRVKIKEDDKLSYDEKNNNIILIRRKEILVINPDKGLGLDEVKKIDFHDHKLITTIEVREGSYFIYGSWEYVITDFKGNTIKQEHFKQPGEGLRHLKNIGSTVLAVGGMVNTLSGVTNGSTGAVLTGGGAFVGNRNLMDEGERKMRSGSNQINNGAAMIDAANLLWDGERYNAFKATKNSAFFYTKKNDKKVLLQINKDTGDAVESFEFGINEPKYKLDEAAKKIYFRNGSDLKIFTFN
ncbi:PQQ-binding-like beta-propeller repeat protein [uncultured Tenacibaculum sp.]|uniref:outer membrane protein assembly factor BamB family protein n=1 Tax=uncultured Tenacibaculum sp. TaxID=174713 RepID=UPI002634A69F|nr:PQQ-binding-like beta-propeller repeat protein [uncultured Tenacibaculum sp.]